MIYRWRGDRTFFPPSGFPNDMHRWTPLHETHGTVVAINWRAASTNLPVFARIVFGTHSSLNLSASSTPSKSYSPSCISFTDIFDHWERLPDSIQLIYRLNAWKPAALLANRFASDVLQKISRGSLEPKDTYHQPQCWSISFPYRGIVWWLQN